MAASADGKSVYVTSASILPGLSAVLAFRRDPATGALAQDPPPAGCVGETPAGVCRDGRGLDGAVAVAVAPDGASVYVASLFVDAVAILDRDTTPPPPPPPPPPPAGRGPDAGGDRTPPVLSRLTASRRRFRVGRAPRRGTRLAFTLSEPARVSFTVLAVGEGRRTAKGCRKRTRANRGHRPCRLLTPRGRFARSKRAGRSRVAFTGRLGLSALARGRYVVRAVPTDTAGNTGRARTLRLRVVRASRSGHQPSRLRQRM